MVCQMPGWKRRFDQQTISIGDSLISPPDSVRENFRLQGILVLLVYSAKIAKLHYIGRCHYNDPSVTYQSIQVNGGYCKQETNQNGIKEV